MPQAKDKKPAPQSPATPAWPAPAFNRRQDWKDNVYRKAVHKHLDIVDDEDMDLSRNQIGVTTNGLVAIIGGMLAAAGIAYAAALQMNQPPPAAEEKPPAAVAPAAPEAMKFRVKVGKGGETIKVIE